MFDTHMLNDQGKRQMTAFKATVAQSTKLVLDEMPECREKSIFITKMEEAVFFGAKAIASAEGNFETITTY